MQLAWSLIPAVLRCDLWPAAGGPPYPDGSPKAGDHLRKIFYRMGFNDQEIVALSGTGDLLLACFHACSLFKGYKAHLQSQSFMMNFIMRQAPCANFNAPLSSGKCCTH